MTDLSPRISDKLRCHSRGIHTIYQSSPLIYFIHSFLIEVLFHLIDKTSQQTYLYSLVVISSYCKCILIIM